MDALTDIERLVAIEEIKLLKARRDRAVDTKDWDGYEALHAPDHYSQHGTPHDGLDRWNRSEMMDNIRDRLGLVDTVHHSHTPEITFESPTRARGIWSMEDNLYWWQGTEEHWLRGYGFYHETYEKRDGRWLFTSRSLKRTHVHTSVGAALGTDLVTPKP